MQWRAGSDATVAGSDAVTRIHSHGRHGHWLPLIVGIAFLLALLPARDDLFNDFLAGQYAVALALIFPVAGLFIIGIGLRNWRTYRHFGPAALLLDPAPGQAGGQVGGELQLAQPWGRGHRFAALLSCISIRRTGSGNSSSNTEHLVWQCEQRPFGGARMRGSVLHFCFDVPGHLPPTGSEGDQRIVWRVHIEGDVDGHRLCRTYEIPVACGEARSRQQLPERHVAEDREHRITRALEAASAQVRVEPIGNGLRLLSRAGRNVGICTGLVFIGGVFGGAGGWLVHEALQGTWMLFLMAVPFVAIGLLVFSTGLWLFGRSLEVEIRNGTISSRRHWLGIRFGSRHGRLERADQLTLRSNMRSGSGSATVEFVTLAATQDAGAVPLAESIAGREVGEALKASVIQALRLR